MISILHARILKKHRKPPLMAFIDSPRPQYLLRMKMAFATRPLENPIPKVFLLRLGTAYLSNGFQNILIFRFRDIMGGFPIRLWFLDRISMNFSNPRKKFLMSISPGLICDFIVILIGNSMKILKILKNNKN